MFILSRRQFGFIRSIAIFDHFNQFLGVSLRVGLYVAIFLLVPRKKDFHFNP